MDSEIKKTPKKKKVINSKKEYAKRLANFSSFYLMIVLLAFAAIVIGIYIAIANDTFLGVVIVVAAAVMYVNFVSGELWEKLGIAYKTALGSLTVKSCTPRYGKTFFIPKKLIWYDVEAIDDNAFRSKRSAEIVEVFIPSSVKRIGKDIFVACESLERVAFEGSEDEWEKIEKETDFSSLELSFGAKYPKPPKKKKATDSPTPTQEQ